MPTLTYIDEPVPKDLPLIAQGEDWNWSFGLNDSTGAPLNLTGASFTCMMREDRESRDVTFTPTVTIAANVVTLKLARTVTAVVTQSKSLVYDVIWTDSLGNKLMILRGAVEFLAAVTR
jgi:hypothetical protein